MTSSLTDPLGAARVVVHMLEKAAEFGLTITCSSDFDEFIEVRHGRRGGAVSPMFDPAITQLDNSRAFWMQALLNGTDVVSLQAFRLDIVHTNLAEWALGWMAGLYIKRQELVMPSSIEPPEHSRSRLLKGGLVYHGEAWIDNKAMKKREWFDHFLKLGMLISLIKWHPDAVWALTSKAFVTHGLVARAGYGLQERGFLKWHEEWQPSGAEPTEWLMVAERNHLEFLIAEEASKLP
ncbi:hypothetical protein [Taklimakanibacter lacteus]|uniref:hypothetical protein n=1 Tax=Taklimakanibacter lacteus TaxID=2268456 RepID=UPI0013C51B2F